MHVLWGIVDACGVMVFLLNLNLMHQLRLDYIWHVLASTNTLEQDSVGERDCGIEYSVDSTRLCRWLSKTLQVRETVGLSIIQLLCVAYLGSSFLLKGFSMFFLLFLSIFYLFIGDTLLFYIYAYLLYYFGVSYKKLHSYKCFRWLCSSYTGGPKTRVSWEKVTMRVNYHKIGTKNWVRNFIGCILITMV